MICAQGQTYSLHFHTSSKIPLMHATTVNENQRSWQICFKTFNMFFVEKPTVEMCVVIVLQCMASLSRYHMNEYQLLWRYINNYIREQIFCTNLLDNISSITQNYFCLIMNSLKMSVRDAANGTEPSKYHHLQHQTKYLRLEHIKLDFNKNI